MASACSQQSERSRVVIAFDDSVLSASNKTASVKKENAINTNGPNWGLVDPVAIEDIDCFGIFVYADEEGMRESSCTMANGNTM
ncbi:MAG: hypothetical protein MJK18_10495, partial [Bdellovibrionales bacterium]|nr:hypothetical protein [Bdellovibrionales bacterium]